MCISTVCIVGFILPTEIQNLLKARHSVFNPLTYITASFIHGDVEHLISNLFGFNLFLFLNYYFSKKAAKRRAYFGTLMVLFIALPILNYSLLFFSGLYSSRESSFGFGLSLVGSGLLGSCITFLLLYFERRIKNFDALFFMLSTSLFTFSIIFLPYPSSFREVLFLLCLVSGLIVGVSPAKKILKFSLRLWKDPKTVLETTLVSMVFPLYLLSVFLLFPQIIVIEGGIIDIASRLIGLLFGIFIISILIRLSVRTYRYATDVIEREGKNARAHGEEISEEDSLCPHCGALIEEPAYDAISDEMDHDA